MNSFRVPILREVDGSTSESDPDHIRGAKYANLLFGTDYGKGSVVEVVFLDTIRSPFFERFEAERPSATNSPLYRQFKQEVSMGEGVICVDNTNLLPPEFHRDPARAPQEAAEQ